MTVPRTTLFTVPGSWLRALRAIAASFSWPPRRGSPSRFTFPLRPFRKRRSPPRQDVHGFGLDGDVDAGADREAEALGDALGHKRLEPGRRVDRDEDVPALQRQADDPAVQNGGGGRRVAGPPHLHVLGPYDHRS